ncbi:MAG: polysaccharide deacetylase, partial [Gemmatimonadales bacterium]
MSLLKQSIERLLGAPGAKSAFRSYRQGVGTIFMLHRFNDPVTGATGDDPQALRAALAFLRRRGYELVALEEMFKRLREGHEHSDLGVAFTLDDGYAD